MNRLPDKIVLIHEALEQAELSHAFGGALALAWCTQRARGTIDIDVNVFVGTNECDAVVAALPDEVSISDQARVALRRDGQVRMWWDDTPVDVFLNTTAYHAEASSRTRWETFAGQPVPFLSCLDVAVFKAFFNRTKDWADLEEMLAAGTLDIARVTAVLVRHLGADDERIAHLNALSAG